MIPASRMYAFGTAPFATRPHHRLQSGFTLIELGVVMAIVAILAMIAIPNYSSHLVKSRRGAAQAFMMDVAQRQEQYFIATRRYADNLAELNLPVGTDVSRFYTVQSQVTAGTSVAQSEFVVTAVPRAGTPQAADGTLTLDSKGRKTPARAW